MYSERSLTQRAAFFFPFPENEDIFMLPVITSLAGKSGFQMTVEKPKPKQLLRPITTRTKSAMNQSQFLAVTCYLLEARENHAYKVRLVLFLLLIG